MSDEICHTPHEVEGNTIPQPCVGSLDTQRGIADDFRLEVTPFQPDEAWCEPVCPPAPLKRAKNGIRGRFWCFTLNNPTQQDSWRLHNIGPQRDDIRFLVIGRETGESGTEHFQGYIEMIKTVSMVAMKLILGVRVHLEPRRGTAEQARDYCCKDDSEPYVFGTLSVKGARNDLAAVQEALDGGASMKDVATNHFGAFLRYPRGLAQYMSLTRTRKQRVPPRILWLWGPTGSGKSTSARRYLSRFEVDDVFSVSTSPTGTWWNGYNTQNVVYLDDMRGSWFPHHFALRLFDCVTMTVPYHGGASELVAETYVVTTNDPPHMLYKEDPHGALLRRIHDFATVMEISQTSVGDPCAFIRNERKTFD